MAIESIGDVYRVLPSFLFPLLRHLFEFLSFQDDYLVLPSFANVSKVGGDRIDSGRSITLLPYLDPDTTEFYRVFFFAQEGAAL